jgi:hypothetical protein
MIFPEEVLDSPVAIAADSSKQYPSAGDAG